MYQDYELELFCGKMIELFEEEYISALQKVGKCASLFHWFLLITGISANVIAFAERQPRYTQRTDLCPNISGIVLCDSKLSTTASHISDFCLSLARPMNTRVVLWGKKIKRHRHNVEVGEGNVGNGIKKI